MQSSEIVSGRGSAGFVHFCNTHHLYLFTNVVADGLMDSRFFQDWPKRRFITPGNLYLSYAAYFILPPCDRPAFICNGSEVGEWLRCKFAVLAQAAKCKTCAANFVFRERGFASYVRFLLIIVKCSLRSYCMSLTY